MHHNSKQLQQLQVNLTTAHAELSATNIPPFLSGCTISSAVSFPSCNPPIPSKCSSSPNNSSTSSPKIARPEYDNSKPSLTAIARQFFSPTEPTDLKPIHVPARSHLFLQHLRSNLCRLHINTRRILDIHYSDRNLVSFLIHIDYKTEPRLQLNKFNITVSDAFYPLDPSIIRDAILVNEPIDCKAQRAREKFLHRICATLQRFRASIYDAIANFFVQYGLIGLEDLASYDLTSPASTAQDISLTMYKLRG